MKSNTTTAKISYNTSVSGKDGIEIGSKPIGVKVSSIYNAASSRGNTLEKAVKE